MKLRIGTLCLFDNPTDEDGRALIRQFVLVREADRMGYDDIWVIERHGDRLRPTGAVTALLGHLAGVTSKARIGAVLQPEGRDAAQLAEDLSTVELLSRGRLAIAVDAVLHDPGMAAPHAAERGIVSAVDTFATLRARIAAAPADLAPRPSGANPPAWAMTDDADAVGRAAASGLGLWLPPSLPLDAVEPLAAHYSAAASQGGQAGDPQTLLTCYACPAATRDEALAIARPYLEARIGAEDADAIDALIERSLIGSYAEVAGQMRSLATRFGLHGIVIVPTSANFDVAKHILADVVDEVLPLLDE